MVTCQLVVLQEHQNTYLDHRIHFDHSMIHWCWHGGHGCACYGHPVAFEKIHLNLERQVHLLDSSCEVYLRILAYTHKVFSSQCSCGQMSNSFQTCKIHPSRNIYTTMFCSYCRGCLAFSSLILLVRAISKNIKIKIFCIRFLVSYNKSIFFVRIFPISKRYSSVNTGHIFQNPG